MKSIKMNALAFMGIRILNIIFPILTGTYVARVLDKTYYGYFNSVDTILSFFLPFATFGVYTYGLRAISNVRDNKNKTNKVFSQLFYLCMFCTIVTTAIYFATYNLFFENNPTLKKIYLVMGVQLVAQIFSIEWVNEALENYSFLFYKTAVIRVLMLISIFAFVRDEHDIIIYTLIMSLSTALNYVISYFWIKKDVKFVRIKIRDLKPLILPLLAMLLFANANMLYTFLDRIFLVKAGESLYVTYYTMSQRLVTVLAGVITGAIGVSLPRLGYYLGNNDRESYTYLVNKGSRVFNFFIIPLSFGLTLLGPNAILLYGSEKYVAAGTLTSLFAFRTIISALDTILGSQILFVNGFEKRITLYTLCTGILNFIMNFLLFHNNIFKPEFYLITTIISEIVLLIIYITFINKKKLFNLKNIFKYTLKYSLFSSTFLLVYFIVNYIYPAELVINLRFLISTASIILLSICSYIILLVINKDSVFLELYNNLLSLKNKFTTNRRS